MQVLITLTLEGVMLAYPNFQREFHLTRVASKYTIAAVLEQDGRPITFIFRTLNKAEERYAKNEIEMFAIA